MDWIVPWIILYGAVAGLAALSAVIAEMIDNRQARRAASIVERVNELAKPLSESAQIIDEIQRQVKTAPILADKLQAEIQQYNELAQIEKSEIQAVARLLRAEIDRSKQRSFWQGFATYSFFFILGAITSSCLK